MSSAKKTKSGESVNKSGPPIVFIGGGKGGVGKSAVSLATADYLKESGLLVKIIEGDPDIQDVGMVVDSGFEAAAWRLDSERGYADLANYIEANPDKSVVINMAAGTTESLVKHGGVVTSACEQLRRTVMMFFVINRQRDSLEQLLQVVDSNDSVEASSLKFDAIYAVLNSFFGSPEKFIRWRNSKIRNDVSGELVFPELDDMVMDTLANNRLPFWTQGTEQVRLGVGDAGILQRFRKSYLAALKPAFTP